MSDKLAPNIIVVAEDKTMNARICNTIERYRLDVIRAYDPLAIERLVEFNSPHLAVIISKLKNGKPLEIAKKLKDSLLPYKLPVIFLVDKGDNLDEFKSNKEDLIEVMDISFTPNELMISIRDLLRKAEPVLLDRVISYKNISLDLSIERVKKDHNEYSFGPTEFRILKLLIQKPYNIYSRRQIIDYIWGVETEIADRTIDVHINRIRKMLKVNEDKNPLIKTIRSYGYCLDFK